MSSACYLTNAGRALLAKVLAEQRLMYTRAVASPDIADQPEALEYIQTVKQTATVLTVDQQGDCAAISASFNCDDLDQSYQLGMVGIYAKIEGTDRDVLYMVAVFDPTEGTITLPAQQVISYKITIYDAMANGTLSVTVADAAAAPAEHVPNAYRHIFTQTNSSSAEAVVDSGDFSNFASGQKIVFVPAVTLTAGSSRLVMGGQRFNLSAADLAGNPCSCLFLPHKSYVLTFLNGGFTYVKHNGIEVKDGVAHYWNGEGWSTVISAGEIITSAANTAPPGTVLCDGRSLSRTDYAELFAAIGTTYGSSSGTTFKVPDARGRCLIGSSSSYALGSSGGAAEVALTSAQMPAHKHTGSVSGGSHSHPFAVTIPAHAHPLADVSTKSAGAHGHSINNIKVQQAGSHSHAYIKVVQVSSSNDVKIDSQEHGTGYDIKTNTTGSAGEHTHPVGGSLGVASAHAHELQGSTARAGGSTVSAATDSVSVSGTVNLDKTGSGQAHNNMQPYLAVNYYIYTGRSLL